MMDRDDAVGVAIRADGARPVAAVVVPVRLGVLAEARPARVGASVGLGADNHGTALRFLLVHAGCSS